MSRKKRTGSIPRYEASLKEWVPIDSIRPLESNARIHTESQLSVLRDSIARFGLYRPLVVHRETRQILAGNGVYEAARQLGLTEVPVVWYDGAMPDALALSLTDNRAAELSEWDYAILVSSLSQYPELLDAVAVDKEFEEVLRSLMSGSDTLAELTAQESSDWGDATGDTEDDWEDEEDDSESAPPLALRRESASKPSLSLDTASSETPALHYAVTYVVRLTESDLALLQRWAKALDMPCDESVIIEVLRRSETLLDGTDA